MTTITRVNVKQNEEGGVTLSQGPDTIRITKYQAKALAWLLKDLHNGGFPVDHKPYRVDFKGEIDPRPVKL